MYQSAAFLSFETKFISLNCYNIMNNRVTTVLGLNQRLDARCSTVSKEQDNASWTQDATSNDESCPINATACLLYMPYLITLVSRLFDVVYPLKFLSIPILRARHRILPNSSHLLQVNGHEILWLQSQ
jgi:hypothetical protein